MDLAKAKMAIIGYRYYMTKSGALYVIAAKYHIP
jgi:hypothetical protein